MILVENNIVALTKNGDEFTPLVIDYAIINEDEEIEDMKKDFFLFRGGRSYEL